MTTPVILVPRKAELAAVHQFHLENVGEFMLPRAREEFDALAEEGSLWAVVDGIEVVATCYVKREDAETEAEFGGVVVRRDRQGTGLGAALGLIAIAAHFLHDKAPLIAHVHVENSAPLKLLTQSLGFTKRDGPQATISKPDLEARLGHPIAMKADADGVIRGDTYAFDRKSLATFADRVASGTLAASAVEIRNPLFEASLRPKTLTLLRQLASIP